MLLNLAELLIGFVLCGFAVYEGYMYWQRLPYVTLKNYAILGLFILIFCVGIWFIAI